MLGLLEEWWLGVFIAPTTNMAVGEGFCRMAHRTLSGVPATSLGRWIPTVGALTIGATGQSSGAPDRSCRLSGVPSVPALTSACAGAHCSAFNVLCRRPLARSSHCSTGTPDSPVLHRTVRRIIAERPPKFPKLANSESISLVHRTLSGGCARPGLPSVYFVGLSLCFEPFLLTCIGLL
jgi:hypothetical protein